MPPEDIARLTESFPIAGGGRIAFGEKDGHVTYPDFGLDANNNYENKTHESIVSWLNSGVKFDNYYEQLILSRLMYLTNYGIAYPTKNLYTAFNSVTIHDKEKTVAYSGRWAMYERYANLGVMETMGISIDAFMSKSKYETDKIFEICERKMSIKNTALDGIKKGLDDLDK